MSLVPQQIACDHPQCGAVRREVNHWFVVVADDLGVRIYHWEKAPQGAIKRGKHFCGGAHALHYASKMMTPDGAKQNRESTLDLKPPLSRDGESSDTSPKSVQ